MDPQQVSTPQEITASTSATSMLSDERTQQTAPAASCSLSEEPTQSPPSLSEGEEEQLQAEEQGSNDRGESPTVHSHGCNCEDVRLDWFAEWFQTNNLVEKPLHVLQITWDDMKDCNNLSKLLRK